MGGRRSLSWDEVKVLGAAFSLRLAFVFYAQIHDYYFHVNFTDIDYKVFSDAAVHVSHGRSPFDRTTYRYTPFLAWLLVPVRWWPDFGKVLFCVADIVVGWLLIRLKRRRDPDEGLADVYALWLFNPLTAVISARGNADSLVSLAVLGTLDALGSGRWFLAAVIHGLGAVHLRIYPVIYLPSIFLYLLWRESPAPFSSFKDLIYRFLTNWRGFVFAIVSLTCFAAVVAVAYELYGYKCLYEFLLYHFSRHDIRHNFSAYFYPLYLASDDAWLTQVISLGAFVPQLVAVVVFAFKFGGDLEFCWFLTTYAFVSFNKVCTSQYFVWYLIFTPLIASSLTTSATKAVKLFAVWLGAQGLWLLAAYLLEFQAWNTFAAIFAASLLFLITNVGIMVSLIGDYRYRSPPLSSQYRVKSE